MAEDKYLKNRQIAYDLLKKEGYTDIGDSAEKLFENRSNGELAFRLLKEAGYEDLGDDYVALFYGDGDKSSATATKGAEEVQKEAEQTSRDALVAEEAKTQRAERTRQATEGRAMFDEMSRRKGRISVRDRVASTPAFSANTEPVAPHISRPAETAKPAPSAEALAYEANEKVYESSRNSSYSAKDALGADTAFRELAAEGQELQRLSEEYGKKGATKQQADEFSTRAAEYDRRMKELMDSPAGREYKDLVDRYNTLKDVSDTPEIVKEKNRIATLLSRNPIARAMMGDEAPSESQIRFTENRAEAQDIETQMETADRSKRKELKKRLKEVNKELLDNEYYQEDVAKRKQETQAQLDDVLSKMSAIEKRYLAQGKPESAAIDPEYRELNVAAQDYAKTLRQMEHIQDKNANNFWVNFADVFTDLNTYTFGMAGLDRVFATKTAAENPDEVGSQEVLSAVSGQNALQQEIGQFIDSKGRWGSIAGNSIPFAAQIILTGGGGNVANYVSQGVKSKLGRNLFTRVLGAGLGDIAAGFTMANTIGAGKTLTDILDRYYGTLVADGEGGYGYEGGTNLAEAIWKGEAGNTIEFASERAGEHLQRLIGRGILGKAINAARKNGGKINPAVEELAKTMNVYLKDFNYRSSNQASANWMQKAMGGFFKVSNMAGVQGYPFEVMEEYIGLVGNILVGGEEEWMNFSKLGDKETHADIWGGMLYSIGVSQGGAIALGTGGLAYSGIEKARLYHKLESAIAADSASAKELLGEEEWTRIKEEIDGTTNEELAKKVTEYMKNPAYDAKQREAVLDYVKNTYIFRGFNAGTLVQAKERLTGEPGLMSLDINAEAASAQDQVSDAYMLGYNLSTNGAPEEELDEMDRRRRRTAVDANAQMDDIDTAVEKQRAYLEKLTGVSNMSEQDASVLLNDQSVDQKTRDAALDYLMGLAVKRGFIDGEQNRKLQKMAQFQAMLEKQYGGAFYHENAFGDRDVETAFRNNPSTGQPEGIFITGDPNSAGEVPFISQDGKSRGFVRRDDVFDMDADGYAVPGMTNVVPLNDYLEEMYRSYESEREMEVEQEDEAITAEREATESAENNKNSRGIVEGMEAEDGSFSLNGKRGRLIRKDDEGAVFEPEDGTDNTWYSWEDLQRLSAPEDEVTPTESEPAVPGEPVEESAQEEEKPKIPLDKDNNPIYDAPGVSVEDALADMYTTDGLDEADVDEYIINRANEAEKGRAVKQGKMSLKEWGQAKKEANRKADFWKEMKVFAEENKAAREKAAKEDAARQELIKQYGFDTSKFDLTPQTAEEAVSEYLGRSEKLINLDDAIRETLGKRKDNRVPSEIFRHIGAHGILTKQGGRSVADVARDIVGEYEGTMSISEDDVRDAIIDALTNKTKSEIRETIFNNRLQQAQDEADILEEPMEEEYGPVIRTFNTRGGLVEVRTKTTEQDGVKTTKVVALRDGREIVTRGPKTTMPVPEGYTTADVTEGVVGLTELRESADGTKAATALVKLEDGTYSEMETKLVETPTETEPVEEEAEPAVPDNSEAPESAEEAPEAEETEPAGPAEPGGSAEGQAAEGQEEKGGKKPGNTGNNEGNSVPLEEGKAGVPNSAAEITNAAEARAFFENKFGKGKRADNSVRAWELTHKNMTATDKSGGVPVSKMAMSYAEQSGLSEEEAAELVNVGTQLAEDYIVEDGLVKFPQFFKNLVETFGDGIRPFSKQMYLGASANVPDDIADQMDDRKTVRGFDTTIDLNDISDEQSTDSIRDDAGRDSAAVPSGEEGGVGEGEGESNVPADTGTPGEDTEGSGDGDNVGDDSGGGEEGGPEQAGGDSSSADEAVASGSDGGRSGNADGSRRRGGKRGGTNGRGRTGTRTGGTERGESGSAESGESETVTEDTSKEETEKARETAKADKEKAVSEETNTDKLESEKDALKEKLSGLEETEENAAEREKAAGELEAVISRLRELYKNAPKKLESLEKEKVPYVSASDPSGEHSIGSVVPSGVADAMHNAMLRVEKEVGKPLSEFVMEELGYESLEEMFTRDGKDTGLAGEQVDAVALAIYQMKQGRMFINGDMTGIGKGRVGAALIRWAVRHGKKCIFATDKPGLFSDMYRDITDIGSGYNSDSDPGLLPFIINDKDPGNKNKTVTILDSEKNEKVTSPSRSVKQKVFEGDGSSLPSVGETIERERRGPKGGPQFKGKQYDFVMMTYSQAQSAKGVFAKNKLDWLKSYAKDAIIICDESHLAAGQSSRGEYFQDMVKSCGGVTFMSATFAKNPECMALYALRSSMGDARMSNQAFIETMKIYGVPMQEFTAQTLISSGEMVRRERDFTGVETTWTDPKTLYSEEEYTQCRETNDKTVGLIRDVIMFQRTFLDPIIEDMNKSFGTQNAASRQAGEGWFYSYTNTPYSSQVSNICNLMFYAMKAKKAADVAIEKMKKGEKAIIVVDNTLEGYIKDLDGIIKSPDFTAVFEKGAKNILKYRFNKRWKKLDREESEEQGKEVWVEDEDKAEVQEFESIRSSFDETTEAAYLNLLQRIKEYANDKSLTRLSISPIDYIKELINEAGFTCGEITGREVQLAKNEDGTYKKTKRDNERKDTEYRFNGGTAENPLASNEQYDAVILNSAAATGISLHASRRFGNQAKRNMVIVQPAKDQNVEVQVRGRNDRTGQVQRGAYFYITSPIPAEFKTVMMLRKKLASLDAQASGTANVSSNRVDADDMDNKYGDEVAKDFLGEHPEINVQLDSPIQQEKDKNTGEKVWKGRPGLLYQLLIGMQRMTCEEQEMILNSLQEQYIELVEYYEQNGTNELSSSVLDLEAVTIDEGIFVHGKDNASISGFAHDTKLERVEANILKKPMTSSQIYDRMRQLGAINEEGKIDPNYGKRVDLLVEQYAEDKKKELEEKDKEELENLIETIREATPIGEDQTESEYNDAIMKMVPVVDMREKHARDEKANAENLDIQVARVGTATANLKPGAIVMVPLVDGAPSSVPYGPGRFIGFKTPKDGNPKGIKAVFATKDSRASLEIPVVKMKDMILGIARETNNSGDLYDQNLKDIGGSQYDARLTDEDRRQARDEWWDKRVPKNKGRSIRYVITGNLFQAGFNLGTQKKKDKFGYAQKDENVRGKMCLFTRKDAETGRVTVEQGMLLVDSFDPETFYVSDVVKKEDVWESGDAIMDKKSSIKVFRSGGNLVVQFYKRKNEKMAKHPVFKDETIKSLMIGDQFTRTKEYIECYIPEAKVKEGLEHLYKEYGFTKDRLFVMPDSTERVDAIVPDNRPYQEIIDEMKAKYPYYDYAYEVENQLTKLIARHKADIENEDVINQIRDFVAFRQALYRKDYAKYDTSRLAWYALMEQENFEKNTENKTARENAYNKLEAIKTEMASRLGDIANAGTLKHYKQGRHTVKEIEDIFNEFNKDKFNKEMATKVFKKFKGIKEANIPIVFNEKIDNGTGGFSQGQLVEYNWKFFNSDWIPDQQKADVVLHELIHTLTVYARFSIDEGYGYLLSDDMKAISDELGSIYRAIRWAPELKHNNAPDYGTTDWYEMLAEAGSNQSFRDDLKQVKLIKTVRDGDVSFSRVSAGQDLTGKKVLSAHDAIIERLNDLVDAFSETALIEIYRGTGKGEMMYRRAESLRNPINRAAAITKINDISKKLGITFKEDRSLKAKGEFNAKTNEIRINIDAHKNAADIEATLLHEAVAHYGLRKLFGQEWKALRQQLYKQAAPEIKARVDAIAKKFGLSNEVALEEYLAQIAEDGWFDRKEETFWQKVINAIKRMFSKIGIDAGYLTEADLSSMLFASYRNLQTGGALETAARVATAAALRRAAEASHEEEDNGPEDDGPGGTPTNDRTTSAEFKEFFGDWQNDPENASKVVDENGRPKLVAHGSRTAAEFSVFDYDADTEKARGSGKTPAFFFTDMDKANVYARNGLSRGRVIPAYLSIKKPAEIDYEGARFDGVGIIAEVWDRKKREWVRLTNNKDGKNLKYFATEQEAVNEYARLNPGESYVRVGRDLILSREYDAKPAIGEFIDGIDRNVNDGAIVKNIHEVNETIDDYVVFSSNQIKSPDAKSFDMKDPDIYQREFAEEDSLPEGAQNDADNFEVGQDNEILYRRAEEQAIARTADDMYDRATSTIGSAIYASQVDEYAPADDLQETIYAEKNGKKAKLPEKWRLSNRLRELGGQAMSETSRYVKEFMRPMWDAIADFRKAVRGENGKKMTMKELVRYVGLKSGLERNIVFAKRDAKRDYQKEYDARIDELKSRLKQKKAELDRLLKDGEISDVTYASRLAALQTDINEKMAEAEERRKAHFAEVDLGDNGNDAKYKEYRKKDYSALMSWFNVENNLKRRNFPSRKAYQRAVLELQKQYVEGITDLESAEAEARRRVNDIEGQAGDKIVNELWKRINAATKETLDFQVEHNRMSSQQRADILGPMQYYVPMRGFEDNTAEDFYSYYMKPNVSGFAPTILAAKGRTTRYDNPFGMIGYMHSSAVSQGLKNEAVLTLLDFVRKHPKNTLATITRAWFVQTGEVDADGKPVYEVAYPNIPEGATAEERDRAVQAFEEEMAEKKAKGEAYNAHREVQMNGGVVAFEREAHKNEHVVKVYEGGKEYGIIINGNPAAAQAINGVKRQGGYENVLEILRVTRRFLSSMFTTTSIPFWVSNFQRDHGQGLANTISRNKPVYVGKYILNRWKLLPQMFPLVLGGAEKGGKMDKLSPKLANYYRMYVENGGPMGQNRIENDNQFVKQMNRYIALQSYDKAYIARGAAAVFNVLARLGEAVETITRFSTFVTSMEMGRSLHEAISDSKEVSTNFARKGHGRSISWEETGRLETKMGRQLGDNSGGWFTQARNTVDRGLIVGVTAALEFMRAGIPFFNAAIQGIKNKVDTYKKAPVKAALIDGVYFAIGFAMRLFAGGAGGDDDKEKYGHMSDYVRRNNFAMPLDPIREDGKFGGVYHKWALPQEYRYMYALGDILAEAMLQVKPADDLRIDAYQAMAQLLPAGAVDPSESGKDLLVESVKSVSPGGVTPVIEAFENKDFKGSRIYNEGFNGNKENDPGWTKALETTGQGYVAAAEWLNKVTGGGEENAAYRGWIDLNPAIVEHFVKSYFSGPYQILGGFGELIGKKARGEEITTRDIPVWNRIVMNANDNKRDAYYSAMYYYFKDRVKEAQRLEAAMKGHTSEQYNEFRHSQDYAYMLTFGAYDSNERNYNKMRKEALNVGDKELAKEIDRERDTMREEIAKQCLDIYFDRVDWQKWLEEPNSE